MRDDEGCQGNPPCQPASAYFSPLALTINTASPGELPDQTQAPIPLPPPLPVRSARPLARRAPLHPSVRVSPEPLPPRLLLLTCLSTCALPSAVTNQPPPAPASSPSRLAPSSRDSLLRLSSGVFSSVALYLHPPALSPALLINLSRKSRFMQRCVLETLLNLFIYELSLVRRSPQRS